MLTLVQGFTSPVFLSGKQILPTVREKETETVCFYSNGVGAETSSSVTYDTGFRSRMRRMIRGRQRKVDRKLRQVELEQERDQPAVEQEENNTGIIEVRTIQEYKKEVADERNSLVVVRFYAPWCRACAAMEPLYRRLSRSYSSSITSTDSVENHRLPVKFVQVTASGQNSLLHQGLGIPSLPYCHIYSPDGVNVEELSFTKKDVRRVEKILETYVQGEHTDVKVDTTSGMYLSPYVEER